MHQKFLFAIMILVLAAAGLTIGQIWGPVMSWATYTKAVITMGILVALLIFLIVIKADLGSHKNLKDENYLD